MQKNKVEFCRNCLLVVIQIETFNKAASCGINIITMQIAQGLRESNIL